MQWFLWILTILVAFVVSLWVYRVDKRRNIAMPWLTAALRGIVVFLVLLLILAPVITITKNDIQKPVVVLLQDNSRSIAEALSKDSGIYRKNTEQLIQKLSSQYKVIQWGFSNTVRSDSIFSYDGETTDITAALSKAQDFYGAQNLGAVILATDGRFNQGSNPVYEQLPLLCPVYTVAIGDTSMPKDIRVARVYNNKTVAVNSQFEIRADILATRCSGYSGTATLKEDNNIISSIPVNISSDKYDRSIAYTVKTDKTGLHHYVLILNTADGEINTANNRKDIFVDVTDKKKNILIICAAPHPDVNAISDALSGLQSFKVTVKTVDNAPASFSEYQAVILHQVPSYSQSRELPLGSKPVWYILGAQSGIGQFNNWQKNVMAAPAQPHDIFTTYDPSFNTFTVPKDIRAVTDKLPPLSSPVNGLQVLQSGSALFSQKTGSADQPVWLCLQTTVPMAILSGEGIWRWRLYEYKNFNKHDVIDECIRQTVTFLTESNNTTPFKVELPKYVWSDREPVNLNAYLLNANGEQVNTADVQLTITDSAGNKQTFSFERSANAYRINLGIRAGGAYNYTAKTTYNGTNYSTSGSFVVGNTPVELMETGADYPLLYSLAKKYNGAIVPASAIVSLADTLQHNTNIKPVIQSNTDSVPLIERKWFFFLILLFATAEWLLRKYWLAQ